jgi:DNA-binding NarL/FixJ family response regulator
MLLIVDDNVNFISRIIGLLENVVAIKEISVVNNFNEAISFLEDADPDLVLLDINLPGKNGLELLKYIIQKKMQAQVIMLTNHAEDYYKLQCLELGATLFLDKSNDFGLLPGIIKNRISARVV